ncbi:cellulase family glycosylhydrolase [Ketobacter alkanivorans]|uniref:Glycoside hydrolase family 5 domain-containing protein n=1 Tax=Ketobacter alkanivorans TaxID=1917421 RepID=A0A2K9LKF1_9GAMM|nr:cellulase family glycosylhydrolase [Ketobacter alkanivorans]AUM12836.1 hypothetical protein Kalk_10570 [Ketobacter alkanivorans]
MSRWYRSASVFSALFGFVALVGSGSVWAAQCEPPQPAASTRLSEVQVQGQTFVDSQGRVVILRGINVSGDSKVPPFIGVTDASQLDPLPQWGLNTLRLLFTWEAFEPLPCEYEEAYLQYYEQVTAWAAERGLYVIVDFHQDAFSRFSTGGCGEGFPAWAVHSSIRLREPRNDQSCESWGTRMLFDWGHHRAWHHFHRDSEGARSRFLAMVERVANRMAQHSNVIGYDVINEPWGTYSELLSLYEDAGRVIRKQDPSAMLFVPPHAFLSSGLIPNRIPRPGLDNFAYAPHYYDPIMITLKWWLGNSSVGPLNVMWRQAEAWDVPMMLGEFGAPAGTRGGSAYIDQIYDWLDDRLASSAHWNYTPNWHPDTKDGWNHEDLSITGYQAAGADNLTLRDNFAVRPYPAATSGVPVSFRLSAEGLYYHWQHQPERGATELFIPPQWWEQGFQIELLPVDASGADAVWVAPQCRRRGLHLSCDGGQPGGIELFIAPPLDSPLL